VAAAREEDGSNLRRSDQFMECRNASLVIARKEVPPLPKIRSSAHAIAHTLELCDSNLERVAIGNA
jgi:hypothetical protein